MLRLIIPWRIIFLILLGMISIVVYFGAYVGRLTTLSPELSQATQIVATQIAKKLPEEQVSPPLVVLPFKGDYTRTLRDQLQNAVAEQGQYPVVNTGWIGEQLQKIGFDIPIIGDAKSAQSWGSNLGGERILWGEINTLQHKNGQTHVDITAYLYDDNGRLLWTSTQPYIESSTQQQAQSSTIVSQNASSAQAQKWGMVMIWTLGTLALPFILWPITATLIRREHNAAGLFLLIFFAIISTTMAYLLGYWINFWTSPEQMALWLAPTALISLWIYFVICNRLTVYLI